MYTDKTEEILLVLSQRQAAHLAGLIDGDGSIAIRYDYRCGYQLTTTVYSTSFNLMTYLLDTFEGSFRGMPTKGNRKQKYCWYTSDPFVLSSVAPHIRIKSTQCKIAAQFFLLGNEKNPEARAELLRDLQSANADFEPINKDLIKSRVRPSPPSILDYCYLAGLFDAEGSFGIFKKKGSGNGSYTSCIRISNTNGLIFSWLLSKFGGTISHNVRDTRDEGVWSLSEAKGIAGRKERIRKLESLVPYLVTKKDRGLLILDWLKNCSTFSEKEKLEYFDTMKKLNHRGISPEANTSRLSQNEKDKIESDPCSDAGNAAMVTSTA